MIKFILFFLQCSLIKSLNLKNIVGSLLISSSLNSPLKLENVYAQQPATITISNNNIYFYGPITAESCKELDNALIELDKNSKIFSDNFNINPPPINLHIQSEGGSLMNTFYVLDLINSLETPVYTYVDGYVASAGSLISVMGKKRYMTKNSFIMIHQLSSSLGEGKFNDLDDNMDNLNKFMETIRNIYLEKTKIPIDNLNDILEHDLWMNSKESLEYGLVDYII
jgi:ATP-dependent protease ClpP protease subunit